MKDHESVHSLSLSPKEGMVYKKFLRKWQEEIIYFLLVDRFHDGKKREPVSSKARGYGSEVELNKICGGNLKGVKEKLDYIQALGCTAIWLSPVFENNQESYHGYAIQNFLKIDPRFGSVEDLCDLIEEAHKKDIKVFLDCVLNHSGNNWSYKEEECIYNDGMEYEFGDWKITPIPHELRDPEVYKRKGRIENWDEFPETQEGDFFSLKKFDHAETDKGLELQDILFRIYAYWLREIDCDGFRIDAGKHLGQLPLARFCSRIRKYAKDLGKEDFFIFAEVVGSDALLRSFSSPLFSEVESAVYEGPDTFLDFPFHFILPKVVERKEPGMKIFDRYASIENYLAPVKGPFFQLITFLDNHDQIEKSTKERIGFRLNQNQLVASIGLLLTLPGTPCLYYGTEQGFVGRGSHDGCIREAMFDLNGESCAHNEDSFLYREVARLIQIRKEFKSLSMGNFEKLQAFKSSALRMSSEGVFFSRKLSDEELFVAFNPLNETVNVFVIVPRALSKEKALRFVYGLTGEVKPRVSKGNYEIFHLEIPPLKFLILK